MRASRLISGIQTSIVAALGAYIIGCGGGNPTNCLSDSEVDTPFGSYYPRGERPPCDGSIGTNYENIEFEEVVCAFYHDDEDCGDPNTMGCNSWGIVSGDGVRGTASLPEPCDEVCYNESSLQIIDTGVSCNTPYSYRAAPCADVVGPPE